MFLQEMSMFHLRKEVRMSDRPNLDAYHGLSEPKIVQF